MVRELKGDNNYKDLGLLIKIDYFTCFTVVRELISFGQGVNFERTSSTASERPRTNNEDPIPFQSVVIPCLL